MCGTGGSGSTDGGGGYSDSREVSPPEWGLLAGGLAVDMGLPLALFVPCVKAHPFGGQDEAFPSEAGDGTFAGADHLEGLQGFP